MKHDGWIKMHRKLLEWEWYTDSKIVHLFVHLLLKANHKDSKYRGMIIKRGQLITGRKLLSIETGMSERNIRTCLDRLKTTNELTIKATNKYSIVTICNYEIYQPKEDVANQLNVQQSSQQKVQQTTTNKNNKETKEEKNNNIYSLTIESIYKSYPAKCPISGRSTGKKSKDKDKIKSIIKSGKYNLSKGIDIYLKSCNETNTYIKNFGTFLNQLPDLDEIEKPDNNNTIKVDLFGPNYHP